MAIAGVAINSVAAARFSARIAFVASESSSKLETSRPHWWFSGNVYRGEKTLESSRGLLELSHRSCGFALHINRASLHSPDESTEQVVAEEEEEEGEIERDDSGGSTGDETIETSASKSASIDKELKQVVMKTAATFAPRASTASRNPATPGTTLYKVFEAQAYAAMVLGGALSFNLLLPSNHPDIWRLMGMWSVWMFTVPSLRARDCPKNEKEALNYLFLAIPLINVTLPLVWKSFAAVWCADILAFVAIYAWKMEWLSGGGNVEDS